MIEEEDQCEEQRKGKAYENEARKFR